MFGRTNYPPYLCITELVINPTGGPTKVVEGGLQSTLYFYIIVKKHLDLDCFVIRF